MMVSLKVRENCGERTDTQRLVHWNREVMFAVSLRRKAGVTSGLTAD